MLGLLGGAAERRGGQAWPAQTCCSAVLKGKHGKKSSGRKYVVGSQGFWSPAAPWQPCPGLVGSCAFRVSRGVWPLFPVVAPAVPKPSSPLEGIPELSRKVIVVSFYFGTRLQTLLPAWGALAGSQRVPWGCWGHCVAHPSPCGDSPVALPALPSSQGQPVASVPAHGQQLFGI